MTILEMTPCPFCGSNPKRVETQDDAGFFTVYVECIACGGRTKGETAFSRSEMTPPFFARVADAWNRRTTSEERIDLQAAAE